MSTATIGDPAHENATYKVMLAEEPEVLNGEPLNWCVVNKQYGTVEATLTSLPYARITADNLNELLQPQQQ